MRRHGANVLIRWLHPSRYSVDGTNASLSVTNNRFGKRRATTKEEIGGGGWLNVWSLTGITSEACWHNRRSVYCVSKPQGVSPGFGQVWLGMIPESERERRL